MSEQILDLAEGGAFQSKATDPVVSNVATPGDFTGQYPQPLDTTELLAMCEEVTVLQTIPAESTMLKQDYWREMSALQFTSGSSYIAFADGECPEEYNHSGSNLTVTLKNIGAKKSLTESDIRHSMAVSAAGWNGINRLLGGNASSEGMPGGSDFGTFMAEQVMGLKEKEVRLAATLVMNGWDRLLVKGDSTTNALEFSGIENWQADMSVTFHNNLSSSTSGATFSAAEFDRFLSEGCAKPTHIYGHPSAIQEMLSGYFQLGFSGSQVVNYADGNRITPGFNFASFVNTGIGRLVVVSDYNFNRTDAGGGKFKSTLYGLRMTHNGDKLVYRSDQFPLSYKDLAPGCTSVAFQLWAKTALVIKHACAHSAYTATFTGNIVSTCNTIG